MSDPPTTTPDVADAFDAGGWEFTPAVVDDFDRHVRQSVPFYDVIQDAVADLSDWLAPSGSVLVDLGVSTGETFKRITTRHPDRRYQMVGYDTSQPMLTAARAKVPGIETFCQAFEEDLFHSSARLTLCLFTLQFLPPEARVGVLRSARVASQPDGAIIIAEKVREPDARWFEIGAELSWDRKADAGIDSHSIRSKARALRGVLRPATAADNLAMLEAAGWRSPTCLFRWHQWCLFGGFAR